MGAGGGHMLHPFDLPEVKNGKDLIKVFKKTVDHLLKGNNAAVKLDGSNLGIKVIDGPNGKEFAADRASTGEIDIQGITARNIQKRFAKGHGLNNTVLKTLKIFNAALPSIKKELQQLGMWDDPTVYFNCEYVEEGEDEEGKRTAANVVEYGENFIAIHSINQTYEKTNQRTGAYRPGIVRPKGIDGKPISAFAVEIPFKKSVLNSVIRKIKQVSMQDEYGNFNMYHEIPSSLSKKVDFSKTLSSEFKVLASQNEEYDPGFPPTLMNWLNKIDTSPVGKFVTLSNGKKVGAISKLIYKKLWEEKTPLDQLLLDEKEAPSAINGAVFTHATRYLGNDILRQLESPIGKVTDQEGIVIRGVYPNTYKITGEFIVAGQGGRYASMKEDLDEQETSTTIAIVPGAFKPPHRGHLNMVRHYLEIADQVNLLISKPLKQTRKVGDTEITGDDSSQIWKIYLGADASRVNFVETTKASPVSAALEYIAADEPEGPPLNSKIIMGCSEKQDDSGKDVDRFKNIKKYAREDLEIPDPEASACKIGDPSFKHSSDYLMLLTKNPEIYDGMPSSKDSKKSIRDLHASDMRYLLELTSKGNSVAYELLRDFMPNPNLIDSVLNILGVTAFSSPLNEKKTLTWGSLSILVKNVLNEEKMDSQDKQKEKSLKKKMDPYKEEFVQNYMKKGKTRKEAESIYFATIRKKAMKEEDLEEISSVSGGHVEVGGKKEDDTLIREEKNSIIEEVFKLIKRGSIRMNFDRHDFADEYKLRMLIREGIKVVKNKRNNKRILEEKKLRKVIRNLIIETATPDNDPTPHTNTGINVLEDLLKKIIPVLEIDFKKLTSDGNQRESFRAHILQAIEDTLAPQKAVDDVSSMKEPTNLAPDSLEEQEDEIDVRVDKDEDAFIDIRSDSEKKKEEPEDEKDTFGIEGQDKTGRNVAFETFKKINKSIIDSYDVLGNESDKELFYDYLITNLKLYFDKFENDLGGVQEPTTDEYEQQAQSQPAV